jgi:carbonic anhydrase
MKQSKLVIAVAVLVGILYTYNNNISEEKHHSSHWSYEGETGPIHWGSLDPSYKLSDTGKEQSPVDITGSTVSELIQLKLSYKPTPLNIVNNGHTIQVNYEAGNTVQLNEKEYSLLQFHFHTPSEHTVKTEHFPMEMHLVHKNDDGELGVVGVFIEEGSKNEIIEKIWKQMPSESGHVDSKDTVNVQGLLPENLEYHQYHGSLTTPPCSEGVYWIVLSTPIQASTAQVDVFKDLFKFNNRPVQPINDRQIKHR